MAEPGAAANVGRPSRLHSHTVGPAWLRFPFGVHVMSAKFRVEAVFSIEGRGPVLQGTIVSGEIRSGMHVIADRRHRIVAIEGIHGRQIAPGVVALVLDGDASPVAGSILDIT
jgi:hypothetical protein